MIAAFSPFLAWRYLQKRRINLLSIFGVMFAVWAMLVVDSVFTGFVSSIRHDVHDSSPDLLVTDLPHDVGYESLRAAIENERDLVAATAPRLRHYGLLQPLRSPQVMPSRMGSSQIDFDHARSGFALLLGVDPLREPATSNLAGWLQRAPAQFQKHLPFPSELQPTTVLEEADPRRRAQFLLPDDVEWKARKRAGLAVEPDSANYRSSAPGVLFGAERLLRMTWLREGDALDLVCASVAAPKAGTAALQTHSTRVVFAGCYATGHRGFDEPTVLVPIETLRSLLGHDAADVDNPDNIDLITDVAVRLQPGLAGEALAATKRRLQAAVQARLPAGSPPCSVLDWREQNPVMLGAIAHEQAMMQFVLFVVMLVAATVIFATLHLMVVQKTRDIGILASIGGAPRSIGTVFLLGGFTVAVIGTTLGIGLGVLSVWQLNPFNEWLYATFGVEIFPRALFDLTGIPVQLEGEWVIAVGLGALLLSLLVAWLPSRKASRMQPVQALSHE